MTSMRYFDGLELWPCIIVGFADGAEIVETCAPAAAHFWAVYGHRREGGITALGDFLSASTARTVARRLIKQHPSLCKYGRADYSSIGRNENSVPPCVEGEPSASRLGGIAGRRFPQAAAW